MWREKRTTGKCCTRLNIIGKKCKYFQKGLGICAHKHPSTHSYICTNTNKLTYNHNPDTHAHTKHILYEVTHNYAHTKMRTNICYRDFKHQAYQLMSLNIEDNETTLAPKTPTGPEATPPTPHTVEMSKLSLRWPNITHTMPGMGGLSQWPPAQKSI